MTDLAKTSGTSPPSPERVAPTVAVIVSPETFTAYRAALKAFRAIHGQHAPGNEWPAERESYLAGLAKVRADVLGDAYQPGATIMCPKGTKAIYLEAEEFAAYWAAVNAFKAEHGPHFEADPAQREAFGKLKASLLGDRFVPGCSVRLHDPRAFALHKAKSEGLIPAFAPHEASPELIALRRKVRGVRQWLVETFPNCFVEGAAKKPLKVGIIRDILERYRMTSEEADLLREAVGAYRLSHGYRQAYVLGSERINLSGKVVAIVGEDDGDFLNDRLRADLAAQQQRNADKSA